MSWSTTPVTKWTVLILVVLLGYLGSFQISSFDDEFHNDIETELSLLSNRIVLFGDAKKDPSLIDSGVCLKDSITDDHSYCLPSLICIGAMKAGTFELKQWLSVHKLVATSDNELHFFGSGEGGVSKYKMAKKYVSSSSQWRVSDKRIAKGGITFEKTPYYMASSTSAAEIRSLIPSVLMVTILRDPVARAYSAFMHHCDRKKRIVFDSKNRVVMNNDCSLEAHCCCSPLDAPEVVKTTPKCTPNTFQDYLSTTEQDITSPNLGTVLRKGLYASELGVYLNLFPRSQLLVIDQKTFAKDPAETVNRVLTFAGLSTMDFTGRTLKNEAGYIQLKGMDSKSSKQKPYAPMNPSSRTLLEELYLEPDRELAALFPEVAFSWIKA